MTARRIVVEPIGGVGEMGHHHLVLDLGPDSFAIDCGALFPSASDPGIDRIAPPVAPVVRRVAEGRMRGLLLTHGHIDHIGAVRELLQAAPDLPVYGTGFTLRLLDRQLSEAGIGANTIEVTQGVPVQLGQAEVRWIRVNHSIPEASSVSLRSPAGVVVHSGDFRLQEAPLLGLPADVEGLREEGRLGVDLALVDSTGADSPGSTGPEAEVARNIAERIRDVKGLVVIASFGSHVERIVACARAAEATGRRIAVYGRTLEAMVVAARASGLLPMKIAPLRSVKEIVGGPRAQGLLVVTGTQGEFRAPLVRISRREDPLVKLGPGDFVGISARVIPGSETAVGAVVNRLVDAGVEVQPPWDGSAQLHTSGHAKQDEIARWLSWVKPRHVLPVHGQPWHLHRHREFLRSQGVPDDRVLRTRTGERLTLDPDTGETWTEDADAGEQVFLSGRSAWMASEPALRERRKMAQVGSVVAVVTSGRDGPEAAVVLSQGVFAHVDRAGIEAELESELVAGLRDRNLPFAAADPAETARILLRRLVKSRTGTKAVCRVQIRRMVEDVEV